MTNATMQRIGQKLVTDHYSSTEDLVELPVKLYAPEILRSASKGMREKVMTKYFIEMYDFAYRAQLTGNGVKPSQADGVLRTHDKVSKWLKTQNIGDTANLSDPDVMRIYLAEHIASVEAALQVFKDISKLLGGVK